MNIQSITLVTADVHEELLGTEQYGLGGERHIVHFFTFQRVWHKKYTLKFKRLLSST